MSPIPGVRGAWRRGVASGAGRRGAERRGAARRGAARGRAARRGARRRPAPRGARARRGEWRADQLRDATASRRRTVEARAGRAEADAETANGFRERPTKTDDCGFLSRLPLFYNRQYCVIYPNLSIYHTVLGPLQQIATRFSCLYSAQIDDDLSGGGLRSCRRRRPLILSPPLTVKPLKGH